MSVRLAKPALVGLVVVAAALLSGAFAGSAAALPAGCSQLGSTVTCSYTVAETYTFMVPVGVSSLNVAAVGAAGGAGIVGSSGGLGALVENPDVAVSGGEALSVVVGGVGGAGGGVVGGGGGDPGGGGAGGGNLSAGAGAGGGGYSGLLAPSDRPLVIAAGGGGGGVTGGSGGSGGDPDGEAGSPAVLMLGGGGGTTTGGGAGGLPHTGFGARGAEGMSLAGGDGGAGAGMVGDFGGGGGGGGYFGGGGGGGGISPTGGGGGGSSFPFSGVINETTASPASVTVKYTLATTSTGVSAPARGTEGKELAAGSITATLSGATSDATGTIGFAVFGPRSSAPTDCTTGGTPVGRPVTVSGDGTYHPSAGFAPPRAGTYWWYATYSGDGGNHPSVSGCGAGMRSTVVVTPVCPDPKAAFDEGFNAGFQHVFNGAFDHSFQRGFHSGFQRGFHVGFGRAGDVSAHANASRALPPACDHPFNEGFDAGWHSGFNHGFNHGFDVGFNRGFNSGFNAGHKARHHR